MDVEILKYYSRKDVQKKILESAKDREIGVKYGKDGGFGKRPDVLQFDNDILELVKGGATSFHVSEERWKNPLLIQTGMSKSQLDNIRIGWDAILDVDCKFLEYSKVTAELLVEALKFHDVKNIGVKFSGGSGMHIGIPFESFPHSVDGKETKDLFPEGVRVIAEYLKNMIKDPLRERILNLSKIEDIAKAVDKKKEELFEKNIFNPFSVVGIDSVLIASRHLYRAPYSINEKKGLVSIPISPDSIKNFNLNMAKIDNVEIKKTFLPKKVDDYEAGQLIMQAFDALKKKRFILPEGEIKTKREFETPQMAVKAEHWPPCIQMGLKGMGDGKKRFLFILLNFLKSLSWDMDSIEKIVKEWNQKNREPLKEGYIISQLNWHRQHKEKILPPNCANPAYYADLGIKCPEEICSKCKNPVNFSLRKLRMLKQQKKPRRKTRISNK